MKDVKLYMLIEQSLSLNKNSLTVGDEQLYNEIHKNPNPQKYSILAKIKQKSWIHQIGESNTWAN